MKPYGQMRSHGGENAKNAATAGTFELKKVSIKQGSADITMNRHRSSGTQQAVTWTALFGEKYKNHGPD
ncbi:hypothetical protein Ethha_1159 [Ethanoligenens harbinense YUAN-3]|uniref:Uncharacterized protein n=1 Tax=Ethanoligenens harbinense (strain DSM 18485 / JCM 12961 / CGMCC 1.5033 / YUAN-3) TaxID=663278 RepID=E6U504_ETHHY|nr:hypothetical protein Ethha_1159 [Ethanoligenens harbinense YUAN-3]